MDQDLRRELREETERALDAMREHSHRDDADGRDRWDEPTHPVIVVQPPAPIIRESRGSSSHPPGKGWTRNPATIAAAIAGLAGALYALAEAIRAATGH